METSVLEISSSRDMDTTPTEKSGIELSSQSVPKSSGKTAITDYLPPCRICGGVASGFHYGKCK